MSKVVKLSDEVIKQLDKLRHIGQSYDGVLKEILKKRSITCEQDPRTSQKD